MKYRFTISTSMVLLKVPFIMSILADPVLAFAAKSARMKGTCIKMERAIEVIPARKAKKISC